MSIFQIGRQGAGSPPLSGGLGAWVVSWERLTGGGGGSWSGTVQTHITSQFPTNDPVLQFSSDATFEISWSGLFEVRQTSTQGVQNLLRFQAFRSSTGAPFWDRTFFAPIEEGGCESQKLQLLYARGYTLITPSDSQRLRLLWESSGGVGRTVCLRDGHVSVVIRLLSGELVSENQESYYGIPFRVNRLY